MARCCARSARAIEPSPGPYTHESINDLVQAAVHRADPDATGYSAHSLRASFVTYAHLRGASDRP